MLRARLAEDFKGAEGLQETDDGGLVGHGGAEIFNWLVVTGT